MKLVVGLGNPGPRYAGSRHNVGFRIVDRLAAAQGFEFSQERFGGRCATGHVPLVPSAQVSARAEPLVLLEPLTFMNRSGESVSAALANLPEVEPGDDLLVVHDDLDLPLGRIRIRPRGGAGGHRGLGDIIASLESNEFARLRFGIGRPVSDTGPERRQGVVDFVLDGFEPEEQQLLAERISAATEAVVTFLQQGASVAMDRFNADPERLAQRDVD